MAVSVLVNSGGQDFTELAIKVLGSLSILPESVAVPVKGVASELFVYHVGQYQGLSDPDDAMEVKLEDGDLWVNIPSLNESGVNYNPQLKPIGGSTFLLFVGDEILDLSFIPEVEGGNSIYVRNRDIVLISACSETGIF